MSPSEPTPQGTGSASASLAGSDFGATQLVTATLGASTRVRRSATDEPVVIGSDGTAKLQHGNVLANPVVVTDLAGTTTYVLATSATVCDRDYDFVDYTSGVIRACSTGRIAIGQTVLMDYNYDADLPTLRVGVTFASGKAVTVDAFNLEASERGPLTIGAVAASAPAGGVQAFNVLVRTGQTLPVGQGEYGADPSCSTAGTPGCPVVNELVLNSVNMSNALNPCASGTVTASVKDPLDPTATAQSFTLDFDDPNC